MTQHTMILTGDINLMGVKDASVPFAQIAETLRAADVVFSNLECCFYEPPHERSIEEEGFCAPLAAAETLRIAGIHAVGNANNVNFGAAAIRSSVVRLAAVGIPNTGAGIDAEAARAPVILEHDGVRYGFLQRTSVFWNHGHEARDDFPGVATVKAHTAYRPQLEQIRALTRPGLPPEVITWTDPAALDRLRDDIAALRRRVDVLVASHHWGLNEEVLAYQREIARAAIDAGADLVMGHGPHVPLGMEFYKGKPVFYGLGSFSFHTGHFGRVHPDWIGLMVRVSVADGRIGRTAFSFVRHNKRNETVLRPVADEAATLADLRRLSEPYGTVIEADGDELVVTKGA